MTKHQGNPSELPAPKWNDWIGEDLWTLLEAAALLSEREPLDGACSPQEVTAHISNEIARKRFEIAYKALKAATSFYKENKDHPKAIPFLGAIRIAKGLFIARRRVEPVHVVKLAISKGLHLPAQLRGIVQESQEDGPITDAEDKNTENPPDAPIAGLSKRQILAGETWPGNTNLPRLLTDVPHWLATARISKGRQGKQSHMWNPALIAVCIHERKRIPLLQLTRFISENFPDWKGQWEQHKEKL